MLIVALVLIVLLCFLAIPISVSFRFRWHETKQNSIQLQWLFGLVHVRIALANSNPKPYSDRDKPRRSKSRRSEPSSRDILAAIRYRPFRQRMIKFMGDLWRAVQRRDLCLWLRLGLGDPADTGRLWSIVGPLTGMLATVDGATIQLEPDFLDATFELDSSGSIRLVPLQLIYLMIALLLAPPIWQGLRLMRAS